MTLRSTRRPTAVLVLVAAVAAGCGTTTVDETDDTQAADAETGIETGGGTDTGGTESSGSASGDGADASDTGATSAGALPVDADAAIAAIDAEMRGLGDEIAGEGDEDATLAVIEEAWSVASAELAETDPVTEAQLQATIEMVRVAVDRRRPADADKAYDLFTDIVAAR